MQNHFPLTLETAVATLNLYRRPSLDAELFMFRVLFYFSRRVYNY